MMILFWEKRGATWGWMLKDRSIILLSSVLQFAKLWLVVIDDRFEGEIFFGKGWILDTRKFSLRLTQFFFNNLQVLSRGIFCWRFRRFGDERNK